MAFWLLWVFLWHFAITKTTSSLYYHQQKNKKSKQQQQNSIYHQNISLLTLSFNQIYQFAKEKQKIFCLKLLSHKKRLSIDVNFVCFLESKQFLAIPKQLQKYDYYF